MGSAIYQCRKNPRSYLSLNRFSRDGCQMGDLLGSSDGLSELRGMAVRENNFLVANAYKSERYVWSPGHNSLMGRAWVKDI